jgi:hypothetical protein
MAPYAVDIIHLPQPVVLRQILGAVNSGYDPVQTSGVQCNRLSGCGMVSLPVDLREMGILQSF